MRTCGMSQLVVILLCRRHRISTTRRYTRTTYTNDRVRYRFSFSEYCGDNVSLMHDYALARRLTVDPAAGLVFSSGLLVPGELFEVFLYTYLVRLDFENITSYPLPCVFRGKCSTLAYRSSFASLSAPPLRYWRLATTLHVHIQVFCAKQKRSTL